MAKKADATPPRRRIQWNDGFRFHRGDAADAKGALAYDAIRDSVLATGTELLNAGIRHKPQRPKANPGGMPMAATCDRRRGRPLISDVTADTGPARMPDPSAANGKDRPGVLHRAGGEGC